MRDRISSDTLLVLCYQHFKSWHKSKLLTLCLLLSSSYHCSQPIDPDLQPGSLSRDAVVTKVELRRLLQVNDSPYPLPIDVEASPDADKTILLEVPKHADDANISTSIVALRPILTGSYSYASAKINGEDKFFGKDTIDFSAANPIELEVFSEAETKEIYTISVEKKEFPQAAPEAFNIKIKTQVGDEPTNVLPGQKLRVYQTFEGSYEYADVNFDEEATSTFEWLRGDSPDGIFKKIEGMESNIYSTRELDGGKYLKFQVNPVAQSGEGDTLRGKTYSSPVIGPIEQLTGVALAQSKIRIAEIGNKYDDETNNDYIVLHNSSSSSVSLNGLYIGVDASCSITSGFSNYKALPSDANVAANAYYLISRIGNTIGADSTVLGSIGEEACVVLANSSQQPTSSTHTSVIDFVAFGMTTVKGEGDVNAQVLSESHALRRIGSCSGNDQDTDNNGDDFELFDPLGYTKQVRSSSIGSCATMLPPNPLRITEIGNKYDSETNNDYIVLHNSSSSSVSLNGLYIGVDASCSITSGFSNYKALPSDANVAANAYYLISRTGNTIGADSTVLGSIGEDACVVLANSSQQPTSSTHASVIDFVAFGMTTVKGEGDVNAQVLSESHALRRIGSCSGNDQDTDNNGDDFELFDPLGYTKQVRSSSIGSCATILPPNPLRIAEIGNKYDNVTNNDYIVLHNSSSSSVSLNGLYIGFDLGCTITSGFSTSNYKALPSNANIAANAYYLISRTGNTIGADSTVLGSITGNYCVVLANSSQQPTSSTHASVIDFVAFGATTVKEEGGDNAPVLDDGSILRRKMCEQNDQDNDTNNNSNDFEQISAVPDNYMIRSSMNNSCTSVTMMGGNNPGGGSTTLVIAEVGNRINDVNENDYILLYNKTNSPIDLSSYYIGRDASCNISNGWTEYQELSGTISAHGYFLISRASNKVNADFTWSGGGSLNTNYCVTLSNSATPPNSPVDSGVIDFVSFKTGTGEGNTQAGVLSDKRYLFRNGTCLQTDTNNNANDFTRSAAINSGYSPRNGLTASCIPM